jgi:Pao retrotransposon peptidase./Reverse transcriptase (RNA-dependent DNA polymerase)./Integrase core domain.
LNKKYQLCDEYLLQDNLKEIDLLIGIDYYTQFVSGKRIDLEDNLCLWETLFGNVLSGTKYITVDHSDGQENNVNSVLFVDVHFRQDLSESLPRFWDLQTLGIKDPHDVSNDDLALQQFDSTVQFENNRYAVTFPWKNSDRIVQSNYGLALGQLKSVIKRHANDGILEACKQTFDDQLAKGILEIVEDEKGDNKLVHYFPYHAVLRESSSTTKIRLVMNASARQNKSKPSLNDLLYRGPVLLENLGSLLLRFRLNRYALIADIEKAFLNIALQESERDFTRILWVKDPTQPIERENLIILRHTRVPFGVKSSPFLLARVIDTHLSKYDGKFINKLKRDIYVDNIITGVDYECEIQDFVETARKVFNEASLNLREWATNCPNDYYKNMDKTLINTQENQSVLGMNWNVHKDDLSLKFEYHYNNEKVCKRLLLSVYASFFDILGLWCPITTTLKLLIQKTWICKLGWEDEIEDEDKTDFFRIINCMNSVGNIPVGRYLHASLSCDTNYELHAFSDATKDSYAGCVYLKSVSGNETNVNLVFAKSRIAPVKRPTLPRLELLGALIAYRSLKYVHESLDLKITNTYLWIDNQCVIHWIKGTKTLPTFINNRVKEIKSSTFPIIFRYIPTFCNPADIACRGSLKLENCELWWKGPPFLSLATEQWPEFPIDSEQEKFEDLAEDITLVSKHVPNTNENEIRKPVPINEEKFTSFHKLINVTCYVLKFINIKCKKINSYGHITGEEYKNGKEMWIKYIQHVSFSSTIDQLKAGSRDLLALQMGLELNEVNILVSKGRFREIQFRKGESFPVLLPRKCHITTIIINDIHRQCFHSGVSQTLSVLRVEYWIPQGRSTVKTVLNNCVVCKKFKHGSYKSPEFSFLPSYRVNQAIAFTYTAIDYFGPMTITEDKVHKTVWGLIFTCLTTRAVHLELVDSEATTDLILAFRRFIARRGKCKLLLTDNASQFKLLQDVLSSIYSSNELNDYLNREKIIHRYSHPLSPWEGGVYERLISIVKQCLRKSLGNILLTRTQLHTLLVEIESVMNSRPLGYVSEEDFMITPRHFLELKGDMLSQEETYDPIRGKTATFRNVIQLWKKGTSYLDVFWRHWSRSYLDSLKDRRQVMFKQGKTTNIEPREGEVVLIREDKMPRASWPYGVIVKLNPSRDSRVRTAIVRTAHRTEIVRPISMLYPLEY